MLNCCVSRRVSMPPAAPPPPSPPTSSVTLRASALEAAATVVLVRDGAQGIEALLVQRSREVRHMGGMWVFPGGRVDPADNVPGGDEYAAAVNAAIRETHEEAGLVIDPDQLLYISHWTTPKGAKRRFATWFFLVFLEEDQEVQVDGGEIVHHRWLAPQVAFDESADEREEMSLMPPTYVSLVSIEPYDNCEQARAASLRPGQPFTNRAWCRSRAALACSQLS